MKSTVTIERDEDGMWVAECPAIPGCVSQGRTKEEALANVHEAIQLCLEVRAERGLPLTIETRQTEIASARKVMQQDEPAEYRSDLHYSHSPWSQ